MSGVRRSAGRRPRQVLLAGSQTSRIPTSSTHAANLNEPDLRRQLKWLRLLTAHTVYECPSCGERFVGERRCPSCHLFGRWLELGGHCAECDQPILLSDLLE